MINEKQCPKCHITWEHEETIYQYFIREGYSEEKARESAANYGCTPETPQHFGKNVIGIENPDEYDGIGYWLCTECETLFDRFTGEEINDNNTVYRV